MVSFFGLKIGGDKKKPQPKETKPQQQQWKRIDQNTLGEGQYFGTNLQRPTMPSSRPGTSQSSYAPPPALWNGPYAGPASTSSMVDLTVPVPGRKGSFSSLRTTNKLPDANLAMRWGNGSAVDLAPPTFGGSRPGTPTRPGTSSGPTRKKEWVNPLDVHFAKPVMGGSRPGTPSRNSFSKPIRSATHPVEKAAQKPGSTNGSSHTRGAGSIVSLGNSVRSQAGAPSIANTNPVGQTGYPSPPKSVSPISTVDGQTLDDQILDRVLSKPDVPSPPPKVEMMAPKQQSPPSPAMSASPTEERTLHPDDEENWAMPVIQDLRAKRDTLTYHPPRRQSFTMHMDNHERERKASVSSQLQSDQASERTTEEPWLAAKRENRFEVDEEHDPRPKNKHVEGLSGNFAAFDFGDSVRTPTVEPPRPEEQAPSRPKPPVVPLETRNLIDARRPSAPEARRPSQGDELPESPIINRGRPRFGSPVDRSWSNPSSPAPGHQPDWRAPAPADIPSAYPPPRSASRPRAPDAMPQFGQRQPGPPRAAAGAHRGNAERQPHGLTALNPPPSRGFQPQPDVDGRSHNRAPPPRPLNFPKPVVDLRRNQEQLPGSPMSSGPLSPGPLSSEAPTTGESSYIDLDRHLPPPSLAERPPTSPYSRQPMEGDFPTHRGLPRGRTPQPPPGEAPLSPPNNNSSRWKQWRSSLTRSPRSETFNQGPTPAEDAIPDHGYTLPNWDDFDERSDRHRSALPPPLTPYSPYSPWSAAASSSVTSPTPPRLPSPSFPSLEKSISSSNENLAKSFELFYEDSRDYIPEPTQSQQPQRKQSAPLISPVLNDFAEPSSQSPRRVDAVKAPPRPAPITLPPSPRDGLPTSEFGMRSPALVAGKEFSSGFI